MPVIKPPSRPTLDLNGPDGNAYVLLGYAKSAGRNLGWSSEESSKVLEDMKSSNYEHLVKVFLNHFNDHFNVVLTKDLAHLKKVFAKPNVSETSVGLPVLDLTGPDGNAFALLGYAKSAGKKLGWSSEESRKILDDMKSSNYEDLVKTFLTHFSDQFDVVLTSDLAHLKKDFSEPKVTGKKKGMKP